MRNDARYFLAAMIGVLTLAAADSALAKKGKPAATGPAQPVVSAPPAATPKTAVTPVSGTAKAAHDVAPPPPSSATKPTTVPTMIGVWSQPLSSFGKWKARGVNTLIRYEAEGGRVTADEYCAAAVKADLKYVLQDDDELASHWNDLNCVAVSLPDEANATSRVYPYDPVPPATLAARRASIRERTNKPIFFNLDATKMDWQDDATVKAYCDVADVIAFDRYLINRGEGLTTGWPRIVAIIQRLQRLAPGKPLIFFAECSDQDLRVQGWLHDPANQPQGALWAAMMRGPTVQEQTYQLDGAMAAGCAGVAYFPDAIGVNFERFDAITDENAAALTVWNLAHTPIDTPTPAPLPATQDLPPILIINGATYRKAS